MLSSNPIDAVTTPFEIENGKPFPVVKFYDLNNNPVTINTKSNQILIFVTPNDPKNSELLSLIDTITQKANNRIQATTILLCHTLPTHAPNISHYPTIQFLLDRDELANQRLQLYASPTIYLLDSNGQLFNMIAGYSFITPKILVGSVEKLLKTNLEIPISTGKI